MTRQLTNIFGAYDEFDVLFKNLFDASNSHFNAFRECKIDYPTDIYESDNKLNIDIAAIGLDKEDIDISIEGNILKVAYLKKNENSNDEVAESYKPFYKGITRKKFNLGWKISAKYDSAQLEAKLDKGLLKLIIPKSKDSEPIKITINE
jgi:HSP20 family protein